MNFVELNAAETLAAPIFLDWKSLRECTTVRLIIIVIFIILSRLGKMIHKSEMRDSLKLFISCLTCSAERGQIKTCKQYGVAMPMKTDAFDNRPQTEIGTQPRPRDGFTLIGLLAVIVAIGMVVVLLLPALARTKAQAQAIQCLNNHNMLAKAWTMYAADNNNRCVNNFGVAGTELEVNQETYRTWALNVMDWTTSSQNTNASLLQKGLFGSFVQKGLLGPYVASASSYKCPADHYLSTAQIQAGFQTRVRSYSMNGFVGYFSPCPTCVDGPVGSGSDPTYQGISYMDGSPWPQYITLTGISQPSKTFVFLDEQADSINDGYFDNGDQTEPSEPGATWTGSDIPGSYHNGACGFSFADAHSEMHKWQSSSVIVPVKFQAQGGTSGMDAGGSADRNWLCGHACLLPPGVSE
jgi:type II secretory pathway pseudopilin PulG